MVVSPYSHIWDCCCDHGFLGASLLEDHPKAVVHFVDIVPELIQSVESNLNRICPGAQWQTHCLDASKLPLAENPGNHLVIIAGVGGDLTAEILEFICTRNPTLKVDFLLCPVHHHFDLRQKLIQLNLGLKDEALVKENHRFYEVFLVTTEPENNRKVTDVGKAIWHHECAEVYLEQTLNHYQRVQQGQKRNVQLIIDAYKKVKIV
jgi:tRNA (adenine22-N1)-methyltransferase